MPGEVKDPMRAVFYFYANKWSYFIVGGSHIDKLYSDVKLNASHEDWHLFIVAGQNSNMAVSDIRVGSDLEHCTQGYINVTCSGLTHASI